MNRKRGLRRDLEENKNILMIAGGLLLVIIIAYFVTAGGSDKVEVAPTDNGPVVEQPQVVPDTEDEVTIKDGVVYATTYSFAFPKNWTGRIARNNADYTTITLTPPDGEGSIVTFQRQKEEFLDLQGLLQGYLGGVGAASSYYTTVSKLGIRMGGSKGYRLRTVQKKTRQLSLVYFTERNFQSYEFQTNSGDPTTKASTKQVVKVAPVLEKIVSTFKFIKVKKPVTSATGSTSTTK